MPERIAEGEERVKFEASRLGPVAPSLRVAAGHLARAVLAMEAAGCCPVLEDGLAAGNGALRLDDGTLLVTPSGRRPGVARPEDIVQLLSFDAEAWSAAYRSRAPEVRPTSDAPLYVASLVEAPGRFAWPEAPAAALHGHVLETERAARELDLPLSSADTVFSTPPDRRALLALLERAPYPRHRTWIRRGHGFITLGASLDDAIATVRALSTAARRRGLLLA
ncbi:MAG: class II aldolase/adducin family protein [Sandaracinaceae bacterium]